MERGEEGGTNLVRSPCDADSAIAVVAGPVELLAVVEAAGTTGRGGRRKDAGVPEFAAEVFFDDFSSLKVAYFAVRYLLLSK